MTTTAADPTVEARLYDAQGADRAVDVLHDPPRRVRDDQLLWIDVVGRDPEALRAIAAAFDLQPSTVESLVQTGARPMLRRHDAYLHVALRSAEPNGGDDVTVVGVDLVAAPNVVITVRDGPVAAFERFRDEIEGATKVGRLDTATFTAALVDSVLAAYLVLVEDFERRVDWLDEEALRARRPTAVVTELAVLRTRVAALRRALAPHREAFAALARPDFALDDSLGRPWPGLLDRLDTTLGAIEAARELLLGTYDLVMTRVAQRTNDTVKTLTVISAVLLPASLVSSVLGMNFELPFFDDVGNFWIALAAMVALMAGTLVAAVVRDRA